MNFDVEEALLNGTEACNDTGSTAEGLKPLYSNLFLDALQLQASGRDESTDGASGTEPTTYRH